MGLIENGMSPWLISTLPYNFIAILEIITPPQWPPSPPKSQTDRQRTAALAWS